MGHSWAEIEEKFVICGGSVKSPRIINSIMFFIKSVFNGVIKMLPYCLLEFSFFPRAKRSQ